MKINKYLDLREVIPPETWEQYKESAIKLIDSRIPIILERIRELCDSKPILINNWHIGGKFKYRGYRPSTCTVGAKKSMHREGKAIDFTVKNMSSEAVRNVIRKNADELLKMGLTRIERDVSWVHIDFKKTGLSTIYEFKP